MGRTVADNIVEILRSKDVDTVFGLISTSILDLFDALARDSQVRLIPTQHEQGAAFMADGYARVTRRPAVCLVSVGPGATNAITGVAQAYHESSPVIVLCSETSTQVHGRGRSNFHEVDQVALFRPITKWAVRAERAERVPELVRRAFQVATAGRPGPVYLGIPKDFLLAPAATNRLPPARPRTLARSSSRPEDLERALDLLLSASRPFILAGGGVLWSGARDQLRRLAERLAAPVAATPWHRGVVPDDHPLGVGQLGNTGTRPALALAAESDVILVVGATLSELTTDRYGYNVIPRSVRLVQVDIDSEEIGKNYPVEVGLAGDARTVLEALLARMEARGLDEIHWQDHPRVRAVAELKTEWDAWLADLREIDKPAPVGRLTLFHELRDLLDRDAIVVAESGGTAAYTRFALPAYEPQIFPGDFSAMGSGYCMALGAKVAYPERQVVSLSGDGAFMMVLPELQTAVEKEINTVAIIFHNDIYGNMKYKQTELFEGRYLGVDFKYPDFAQIAREFGAWGERIETAEQVREGLARALTAGRPAVLDVVTDPRDQVPPSDIYIRWIKERQMPVSLS
ncbi:MAG: thiamine pyrophosphate-binding protein [Anaerolineae bacterium]